MQLEGNGGREPFKPPPASWLRPLLSLADIFGTKPEILGPPSSPPSTSGQHQYPLITQARPSLSDWPAGNDLFAQQKKPLSVQISQEPQPLAFSANPPVSPLLTHQQQEAEPKVFDQNAENSKFAELLRKRKEYEKADQIETAEALSPQQWAALSPMQQAAAQSNYDLSQAVKKDFESQGKNKSTEAQTKTYNDSVKKIFGSEEFLNYKGMNFAPNTIAFLDSRGITDAERAGRTLDDFLSGSALVSGETFKALEDPVKPPGVLDTGRPDVRGQNIQFAQTLAKGQLAYQEGLAIKLKQGAMLLTDFTSSSTNSAANKSYGALQTQTQQVKLTDVQPSTLAQIDKYMEVLARPDIPAELGLSTIHQDLQERKVSEKESAQVWEHLMERSRQATTGEGKWFEGINSPMRLPGEVAQALGATTLKRRDIPGAK